MSTTVERLGAGLRTTACDLATRLDLSLHDLAAAEAPRLAHLGYRLEEEEVSLRGAWWLLGQWLTAYALGAIDSDARLDEAEEWFYGSAAAPNLPRLAPPLEIGLKASADEVWAFLPYLLDPLGQGTRRQVLDSDDHREDRLRRKRGGVYYTPADVADYMARRDGDSARQRCLDPACGTGVFLRAALATNSSASTYGVDIDALAVEMAAFVLLATSGVGDCTPWSRWHSFRIGLATVDALQLEPGTHLTELGQRARLDAHDKVHELLMSSGDVPPPMDEQEPFRHLGALFPHLVAGADLILSNPPYAALGPREDVEQLRRRYACYRTAPPNPASNTFLPFLEMGWRLGSENSVTAFVVPLAIAYHGGKQFRALRQAMAEQTGAWEFSFFDRTPDALFGDDVKTRTSIVVHRRAPHAISVKVTGLQRWTSRTRYRMWATIEHTDAEPDLVRFIPKLSGATEARLYGVVRNAQKRLSRSVVRAASIEASWEAAEAWGDSVFVAPTAYNWISCARDLRACLSRGHASLSPFTALQFSSSDEADAAYALLASRLVYWLWRVEGDAFHVSRTFLLALPFDFQTLSHGTVLRLGAAGTRQWAAAQATPVCAVNKGKKTVGFSGFADGAASRAAEEVLTTAFGLEREAKALDLERWHREVVIVDATEHRRRTMLDETFGC